MTCLVLAWKFCDGIKLFTMRSVYVLILFKEEDFCVTWFVTSDAVVALDFQVSEGTTQVQNPPSNPR